MEHELDLSGLLQQYSSLKKEVKDYALRVNASKKRIAELESGYEAEDTVSGGLGGKQHYKVRGFPHPLYKREKTMLLNRQLAYEKRKEELEEQLMRVEAAIDDINDSRMRQILKYRYIDGLSWATVSRKIGGTPDALRMETKRFFQNQKKIEKK